MQEGYKKANKRNNQFKKRIGSKCISKKQQGINNVWRSLK
jgi:hypothetical protein